MRVLYLKKYLRNFYTFIKETSTFEPSDSLAHFLTDAYDGDFIRTWLSNKEYETLQANLMSLTKKDNFLEVSNVFDEEGVSCYRISYTLFLKVLDEWEQARSESKEYIAIKVSDDNDVHIFAADKMETN